MWIIFSVALRSLIVPEQSQILVIVCGLGFGVAATAAAGLFVPSAIPIIGIGVTLAATLERIIGSYHAKTNMEVIEKITDTEFLPLYRNLVELHKRRVEAGMLPWKTAGEHSNHLSAYHVYTVITGEFFVQPRTHALLMESYNPETKHFDKPIAEQILTMIYLFGMPGGSKQVNPDQGIEGLMKLGARESVVNLSGFKVSCDAVTKDIHISILAETEFDHPMKGNAAWHAIISPEGMLRIVVLGSGQSPFWLLDALNNQISYPMFGHVAEYSSHAISLWADHVLDKHLALDVYKTDEFKKVFEADTENCEYREIGYLIKIADRASEPIAVLRRGLDSTTHKPAKIFYQ